MGDNATFADCRSHVSAQTDDYQHLLLNDVPMLDVRAPVEFAKGAFPSSRNLPILDDQQRHDIGTVYTQQGQNAAVALGLELATAEVRQQRLDAWSDYLRAHPEAHLYCLRGGLRSRTTQAWLKDRGIDVTLIKGGYKAMRNYALQQFENLSANAPLLVLAGATGSGKTLVIQQWQHAIDLEGKSLHRGSAFGGTFTPQPSQISWENAIAIDWLKRTQISDHPVLVEAESQLIGRIFLPQYLQDAMANSSVVVLEVPLQQRIELLREDYVSHALNHFKKTVPDDPWMALDAHVSENLQRIRKRLGGERCDYLVHCVRGAVKALRDSDDWGGFDHIIEVLLREYYDKLYAHKMQVREQQSIFRGDRESVLQWLAEKYT